MIEPRFRKKLKQLFAPKEVSEFESGVRCVTERHIDMGLYASLVADGLTHHDLQEFCDERGWTAADADVYAHLRGA